MKKKLLAMTLASAMCVSMLAGCGDSSSTNSGGSSASSSDDAYNISVIVKLTEATSTRLWQAQRHTPMSTTT